MVGLFFFSLNLKNFFVLLLHIVLEIISLIYKINYYAFTNMFSFYYKIIQQF